VARALCVLVLLAGTALPTAVVRAQNQAAAPEDGKREFTVSGCLLRNGYASYKIEDAKVEAVDGKPAGNMPADSPLARLKIWNLEGGGNLGPRTGEKVEIVGRTSWKEGGDEEPGAKPVLEVKTIKTVAPSCS
jgi:hypothetical protein